MQTKNVECATMEQLKVFYKRHCNMMQAWSEMLCKRWIPWTHVIPSTGSNNMMNWKCNTPSFEQIKNDGIKSQKCWYVLKLSWKYVCYRFWWIFLNIEWMKSFIKESWKLTKEHFLTLMFILHPKPYEHYFINKILIL